MISAPSTDGGLSVEMQVGAPKKGKPVQIMNMQISTATADSFIVWKKCSKSKMCSGKKFYDKWATGISITKKYSRIINLGSMSLSGIKLSAKTVI